MFRIDVPSAVPALPAPQAAGTPGYFGRGDFSGGTPPTTLTADWANMVQEEITGVVEHAGIAPSKANHAQLLAALNALYLGAGAITGSVANPGYIVLPVGPINLIMQWGFNAALTNQAVNTITFPIAFPTAGLQMIASLGTAINLTSITSGVGASILSRTQGQIAIAATSGGTLGASWLALGL